MYTYSDKTSTSKFKLMSAKFFNSSESVAKADVVAYSILFISFIVGLWIRMKGLGTWPLAVDEYFIVKSVENILQYGLPQFDSGGYYTRGLIYQYLTAGLFALGVKTEFAARFWPVIFNIITIPALYLLAKKLSNKVLASIVVAVFCFSVWEIEMARFARMYTAFQAVFIWYLLNLYRYVIEGNQTAKKWIYIFSFISIFVHEASIFIAALNFVPFVWNKKINIFDLIIAALILGISYFFVTYDFRYIFNEAPIMPSNLTIFEGVSSPIWLPKVLAFSLPSYTLWMFLFIVPLTLSFFSLIKVYIYFKNDFFAIFSASLLIILPLFNLFGLTLFVGLILLLLNWIKIKDLSKNTFKLIYITFFLNLAFWFLFTISSGIIYETMPAISLTGLIKETIKLLFKYPNFDILIIYFRAIPLFTIMAGIILGINIFQVLRNNAEHVWGKRFIYFSVILLLLATTLINTFYNETRYTFYLFPVILLFIVLGIRRLSKEIFKSEKFSWSAFAVILVIFLFISEDFEAYHNVNIDSKEINFRINYNKELTYHYYNRWDFKTPADIINKYGKPEDIVITSYAVIDYYLKDFDYIFNDYRAKNFKNITTFNGTKERWSNGNLIYKNTILDSLISNSNQTVWLVTDNNNIYLKEINLYNKYRKNLYYKTPGNKLLLYKFSRN